MKVIDFFTSHVIFRFNEFKQFMQIRHSDVSDHNCHITLYNYCKKGKLTHIRKNLYVVNSENKYQDSAVHPLLIAGKATEDAILAYHTALESHAVAYTNFNQHTYLTTKKTNPFSFNHQQYRAIFTDALNITHLEQQSIETITMTGIKIYRTTIERTMVDVLDKPSISGGWEEVIRSLEQIIIFDPQLAVNYALSLDCASIVAKLGYFFDSRPEHLSIADNITTQLLLHIPKSPYYIDRKSSLGNGTYVKKWNIIVPNYLHEKQWEENLDAT